MALDVNAQVAVPKAAPRPLLPPHKSNTPGKASTSTTMLRMASRESTSKMAGSLDTIAPMSASGSTRCRRDTLAASCSKLATLPASCSSFASFSEAVCVSPSSTRYPAMALRNAAGFPSMRATSASPSATNALISSARVCSVASSRLWLKTSRASLKAPGSSGGAARQST